MNRYTVTIFWSDKDDKFVAIMPDLLGCSAVGYSPYEALLQLQYAADAWKVAQRQAGNPIPEPSTFTKPRPDPSLT